MIIAIFITEQVSGNVYNVITRWQDDLYCLEQEKWAQQETTQENYTEL